MPRRPENLYPQYHAHAHIYFGPATVARARQMAENAGTPSYGRDEAICQRVDSRAASQQVSAAAKTHLGVGGDDALINSPGAQHVAGELMRLAPQG
jgi:hypothetical protein